MLIRSFLPRVSIVLFVLVLTKATAVLSTISQDEATSFVRTLSDRAVQILTRNDLSDVECMYYLHELLKTMADLETIGRFVLGPYWNRASITEQTEFLKLFEDITIRTWSRRFKEYSGENLSILGIQPTEDNDIVVVISHFHQLQRTPILVLWKLQRTKEKGLRIIDLIVEGVSMVTTYRSEYGSVIQHTGGDIEGLLEALRAKTNRL